MAVEFPVNPGGIPIALTTVDKAARASDGAGDVCPISDTGKITADATLMRIIRPTFFHEEVLVNCFVTGLSIVRLLKIACSAFLGKLMPIVSNILRVLTTSFSTN